MRARLLRDGRLRLSFAAAPGWLVGTVTVVSFASVELLRLGLEALAAERAVDWPAGSLALVAAGVLALACWPRRVVTLREDGTGATAEWRLAGLSLGRRRLEGRPEIRLWSPPPRRFPPRLFAERLTLRWPGLELELAGGWSELRAAAEQAAALLKTEWSDDSPDGRSLDEARAVADRLGLRLPPGRVLFTRFRRQESGDLGVSLPLRAHWSAWPAVLGAAVALLLVREWLEFRHGLPLDSAFPPGLGLMLFLLLFRGRRRELVASPEGLTWDGRRAPAGPGLRCDAVVGVVTVNLALRDEDRLLAEWRTSLGEVEGPWVARVLTRLARDAERTA